MAIKFTHKEGILALKKWFPKYYGKYTTAKVKWDADFAKNDFENAFISGKGKNEKLTLQTKLSVESKSIPIVFIENAEGVLTIEVNGKIIYTVKSKEGISNNLLDALSLAVTKEY